MKEKNQTKNEDVLKAKCKRTSQWQEQTTIWEVEPGSISKLVDVKF